MSIKYEGTTVCESPIGGLTLDTVRRAIKELEACEPIKWEGLEKPDLSKFFRALESAAMMTRFERQPKVVLQTPHMEVMTADWMPKDEVWIIDSKKWDGTLLAFVNVLLQGVRARVSVLFNSSWKEEELIELFRKYMSGATSVRIVNVGLEVSDE